MASPAYQTVLVKGVTDLRLMNMLSVNAALVLDSGASTNFFSDKALVIGKPNDHHLGTCTPPQHNKAYSLHICPTAELILAHHTALTLLAPSST